MSTLSVDVFMAGDPRDRLEYGRELEALVDMVPSRGLRLTAQPGMRNQTRSVKEGLAELARVKIQVDREKFWRARALEREEPPRFKVRVIEPVQVCACCEEVRQTEEVVEEDEPMPVRVCPPCLDMMKIMRDMRTVRR